MVLFIESGSRIFREKVFFYQNISDFFERERIDWSSAENHPVRNFTHMYVSVSYFFEYQFQPVSVERMFNFLYDCRDTNLCLKTAAVVCCVVLLFLFVMK